MPTRDVLEGLFNYKNGHLYWKISRGCRGRGSQAGTPRANKYIQVRINRRFFREHHLIWIMEKGSIPAGYEIDHVNHIRDDNQIDNLRLVTRAQNRRNASLASNNTSGTSGVYFNKTHQLWCARINPSPNRTIVLGCRKDKKQAVALRLAAQERLGYHPNHGQQQPV